jgi:hypothetical protein
VVVSRDTVGVRAGESVPVGGSMTAFSSHCATTEAPKVVSWLRDMVESVVVVVVVVVVVMEDLSIFECGGRLGVTRSQAIELGGSGQGQWLVDGWSKDVRAEGRSEE